MGNVPEFSAKTVRIWLHQLGVKKLLVELGGPWENNRHTEIFNGKFTSDLHDRVNLYTLLEAQAKVEGWRNEYDQVWANRALGYLPSPLEISISPALTFEQKDLQYVLNRKMGRFCALGKAVTKTKH